jgi:hypothetical protein
MVGTTIRIIIGFLIASVVAGAVQLAFAITPMEIVTDDPEKLSTNGVLALYSATQCGVFAAPFALLMVAIGEAQSIRSWAFYALAGIAIATVGFVALYSSEGIGQPTIVNNYALTAFLTSGLASGVFYWIFAGRLAGSAPQRTMGGTKGTSGSAPLASRA